MTDQVFITPHPPDPLLEAQAMRIVDSIEPGRQGNAITDLQEQVAMLADLIAQQMEHFERLENRVECIDDRVKDLQGNVATLQVERDRMRTKVDNLEKDMAQVATMLGRYTQSIAALRDEADHVEGFIAGHKKVHEERGLTGKWNFRARSPKS